MHLALLTRQLQHASLIGIPSSPPFAPRFCHKLLKIGLIVRITSIYCMKLLKYYHLNWLQTSDLDSYKIFQYTKILHPLAPKFWWTECLPGFYYILSILHSSPLILRSDITSIGTQILMSRMSTKFLPYPVNFTLVPTSFKLSYFWVFAYFESSILRFLEKYFTLFRAPIFENYNLL